MSRPCVCGGSNENCRYCSGRGEIPDRLANALNAHSHRPEAAKVRLGGKKHHVKRISVKSSGRKKFEDPLTKLKQLSAAIFGFRLQPPTPNGRPGGSQLSPNDVDSHLQQVHPSAPVKQQLPATVRARRQEAGYEFCPECNVRVKTSRLKRHLRKVHKTRSGQVIAHSATDVLRESTTLVAPRDKNLDVTKPYAHSYREGGRFGSHPSHDGFDDESGPD